MEIDHFFFRDKGPAIHISLQKERPEAETSFRLEEVVPRHYILSEN